MSSTIIVVDLGFGDAGKGTIVDALARQCSTPPLVVRFNGGAQAGHNVVTSDGKQHVFSQFGAATFVPGSKTLLTNHFILHPQALVEEEKHLVSQGVLDAKSRLMIDGRALVATPFHQAANRLKELVRGADRHGTCGLGIGETVQDFLEYPEFAVQAADLKNPRALEWKLLCTQYHKKAQINTPKLLCEIDSGRPDYHEVLQELRVLDSDIKKTVELFLKIGEGLNILTKQESLSQIQDSEHVIFEGAQGVLLDEWYGFHPHTTWSTTTTRNADVLLELSGRKGSVRRVGVMRAYATRHGQGPFPTEDAELTKTLREATNPDDGPQSAFRCGWMDLSLIHYALDVCSKSGSPITEIAVTCMDRIVGLPEVKVSTGYVLPEGKEHFFKFSAGGIRSGNAGDLDYQQRLGDALREVRPILTEISNPETLIPVTVSLTTHLHVTILSYGPTAEDKRYIETKPQKTLERFSDWPSEIG